MTQTGETPSCNIARPDNFSFYIDLEDPVGISLSAMVDKKPFSLDGTVGPIGKQLPRSSFGVPGLQSGIAS